MKFLFGTIGLIMLTVSCSEQQTEQVTKAIRVKQINSYSADDFVINVTDIALFRDRIILLDEGLAKIIVTTEKVDTWELFGNRGYGPQELISPTMFISNGDNSIYVYDVQKMKISPIDFEEKVTGEELTLGFPIMKQSPLISDSIVYFTTPVEQTTDIKKFDLRLEKNLTGIKLPSNSEVSFFGRHIFSLADNIITVSGNDAPVIETYDQNWNLLNATSLEAHPLITKRLNYKTESKLGVKKLSDGGASPITSAKITVNCARLYNDNLYLLIFTLGSDFESRSNIILKYEYVDDSWRQLGEIMLPEEGSYQTFALIDDGESLIAFEKINGMIEVFELSK
jgi:hypothetical protein